MIDNTTSETEGGIPLARRTNIKRAGAIAIAAFALGGAVASAAFQHRQPALLMLAPAPVTSMRDWSPVAVKGAVAEIFGNKFVIQDDSGRALVETGPTGDRSPLVAKAEIVTVQGRFEHGFIHAQVIMHQDGRNDDVGPPPHPRGEPLHDGQGRKNAPDRG